MDGSPRADLAIVPAAGRGERLGAGLPKAWVGLRGLPLVATTVRRLHESGLCPRLVVVSDPPDPAWNDPRRWHDAGCPNVVAVVAGGETRHRSVMNGLAASGVADDALVLVHDAARPLVAASDVAAVLEAAAGCGAAVGGWPLADTIKRIDEGGRVVASVDRRGLFAAATPQAFRAGALRLVSAEAGAGALEATDEATLFEKAGRPVATVPVSRFVFKVTWPQDLLDVERLVRLEEMGG